MRHAPVLYCCIAALLLVLLMPADIRAATVEEPAYRSATLAAGYPWSEGLILDLPADEAQCLARYGQRWRAKCAAALGRPGDDARGLRLTPALPGHWQWQGPGTLVFRPAAGAVFTPGGRYSVDLTGLRLPLSVRLGTTALSLRMPPRAVRLGEFRFWTDPSPRAAHRLTAALEFNAPVGAADAPRLALTLPEGAACGPVETVWNAARDQVHLSWPVTALPPQNAEARLLVSGLHSFTLEDGRPRYFAPGKEQGAVFRQRLPGRDALFGVTKAALDTELDPELNRRHVLDLRTSLYALPAGVRARLEVWELPERATPEAVRPCDWLAAPAVPAEALKRSRRLTPVPLQDDDAPTSRLRFALPVTAGRYVLVALPADCASASGQKLGRPWRAILRAAPAQAGLGFLQPGNVLPLSEQRILDIYASDLESVQWRAQRVRDPFLALTAAASDEAFARPLEKSGLDMDLVSEARQGSLPLPAARPGQAQFAALDLGEALSGDKSGLLLVTLSGRKNNEEQAEARRMVLVTDLGLMVKRSVGDTLDCFVYRLGAGTPAAGATVDILGANGKAVASAVTDARGHAAIASLSGLRRGSRPVAAVARLGDDLAWLPLEDPSRALRTSEFRTGGRRAAPDGLIAHVFSQRGIYRPGETLHFGCITRRSDLSVVPASLPLMAELTDPRGRAVMKHHFQAGAGGLALLDWPAPQGAASGMYTLQVRPAGCGETLGSTTVRIEEFAPETLRLHIDAPAPRGWLRLDGRDAAVSFGLDNLYGSPAAGRTVRPRVRVEPAHFRFAGLEDYVFTDAARFPGQGVERELAPLVTDAQGKAALTLPADIVGASSVRVTVAAEGFEADGGRATTGETSFLASPMAAMLGYRPSAATGTLDYIPQGARAELEFLAVDQNLRPVPMPGLEFVLSSRRMLTSLVSDGNGGCRYDEIAQETALDTRHLDVRANGLRVPLATEAAGEYLLSVRDRHGVVLASVPYLVAGERVAAPDAAAAAARLRLRLNRDHYAAGETAELALSLPYDGTGLITVERDGVAAFAWFRATAGEHVERITIPDGFEGRGYINVSFARAPGSPAIHMEPHCFAVAPFSANILNRDLGLRLSMPQTALPGSSLPVRVRAAERGKAVLFAVDEGVLQLTGFASPSPLTALLEDRALEVRTLHALDLLMPGHARIASRLSAFGGGLGGVAFGASFQNPFKRRNEPPVTFWSALIPVGPDDADSAPVKIPVPEYYNGTLRVMVVGVSEGRAGSSSARVTVRAPLVLTPQLPLTVSPGDRFEGALVIANTGPQATDVRLESHCDAALRLEQPLPARLRVGAGAEIVVPFAASVADEPGEARMRFSARSGTNGAEVRSRTASLSVRPATPLTTSVRAGSLNQSATLETGRDLYAVNASSAFSLSALPLALAQGFAGYLAGYPYGCTEQIVSRAFAALLAASYAPASLRRAPHGEDAIGIAVAAIRARFDGNGVALWPDAQADPLLTAYAADFLLCLREQGQGSADDLLPVLCDALERGCALNDSSLDAARAVAYGIWVLTREGRITTQLLENLESALAERGVTGWRTDICAALMAASKRQMRMRGAALPARPDYAGAAHGQEARGGWFDEYAQQALYMTLLARSFPERLDPAQRRAFFDATATTLTAGRFATFSASQGVRALMALGDAEKSDISAATVRCADAAPQMAETGRQLPEAQPESLPESLADGALLRLSLPRCRAWHVDVPAQSPPLYWQTVTTGYDRRPEVRAEARGIEVSRALLDADDRPLSEVRQGQVVTVKITVRAMQARLADCVVSDLLPGGFEMVLPRHGQHEALPEGVKYADRREDRMLLFADLRSEPLVFTYRIRAVNRGRFAVPPVYAAAMYDQARYGRGAAGAITVLPQEDGPATTARPDEAKSDVKKDNAHADRPGR